MASWSAAVVAAHRGSGRPAVIDGERTVTGAQLLGAAAAAVRWVDALGLPPGAPLPALVTTNADTFALLLAGAATGHPLAPLGPRLPVPELVVPLCDLGGHVLLHEPAFAETAGETGRVSGARPVPVPVFADDGGEPDRLAVPGPESVGVYLHTGGTTGAPKRVPLTQQVLARRSAVLSELVRFDQPDAVFATGSPVHHIGGLGNVLVALSAGATVVATPSFGVDWWRGLKALGVTHALLVPSMIEMLLTADALDTVPLRTLVYGASPIHPDTLRRVLEVLPGVRMVNLFGQTEGSPITSLTPADHLRALDGRPDLLRSVGRPVRGLTLRVEDPDETGAGELLVRAGHLSLPGPDGWLRTGDLGTVDDEGYVYLAGRTHDRIVRGGENVYPLEVEQVLRAHPAIASAGVVGVPDRRLGQTIAAFLVPVGELPAAGELHAFVRARLAGFKVPAFWYEVPALPHTGAGKLLRRQLAVWHADPAAADQRIKPIIQVDI
ncbi:AMP-binding protein [Amycolatopsis acidiphila]|uniref:Long-chain fatty acid--CoA ligase n=1 Tax=Amycolatopsis acidiphila TaxID=715473 RepID=A0A558AA56_9PSEU|nr:long-chain fatty acid--CoA ligase [Amycolatopsis acidiphila]TVT21148.1 long-chain fatty acid--CoA ligase [Amycolatopsis acidiphila]UIJ57235.1 AMP-binding protein [Amycolatopsis acidiphila]GHG52490.1 acyl-CoA synthetase [Amycolatopsis acidiphila]